LIRCEGKRRAGLSAVLALTVACALVPAGATQSSTSGGETKKTASHKRHKASAASSKSAATSKTTASSKRSSRKKKTARVRGQQKIDSERAQSIQEALIREHYMGGEATGTWNQASEDAMRKYQADHGWQSKTVPDSRALIKLGLGPSKDHLLNPESAMTTIPDPPKGSPTATTSRTSPPTTNSSVPVSSPAAAESSSPQ